MAIKMVHKDFLSALKVLYLAKQKYAKHNYEKLSKEFEHSQSPLFILGNGPSLKHQENKINENRHKVKLLTINQFYKADAFWRWKPEIHLLQANEYWSDNVSDKYQKLQKETIENLMKVTWKMYIFLPQLATKKTFIKEISQNPNLEIKFFNQVPVDGSEIINYYFWNKGLGTPRIHNTLVAAIYLSLMLKFKQIFLFGTDHDWHKHISLDNNRLRTSYKHAFWQSKNNTVEKLDGTDFLLHEQFKKLYLTFKGYHDLKILIQKKGAVVINTTQNSYIDAYTKDEKWNLTI